MGQEKGGNASRHRKYMFFACRRLSNLVYYYGASLRSFLAPKRKYWGP